MDQTDFGPIPEGHSQADFIKDLNFGDIELDDPLTKAALEDHPKDEWIDILGNGQLRKKTISKGKKGFRPSRYDLCTLKISGELLDSRKVVEEHKEMTIQVGDVEVIQGLDLAIILMEVGEIAEIEVASRFAYGEIGLPPDVPPGATLLYTVELISLDMETQMEDLHFQQRRNIGIQKRERGNWWFARDEPTLAIQCYRRALNFLNSTEPANGSGDGANSSEETVSDADLQALLEDRTVVYNNLAAAQIKIEAYDAALESVENVLRSQPLNMKALFRKGKILHKKGDNAAAQAVLIQAAKEFPNSKAIQHELTIVRERNKRDTIHEKNLYSKMLGSPNDRAAQFSTNNNNNKHKKGEVEENTSTKSSTRIAPLSILGGAAAAIAGVLAYRLAF